MACAPGRWRRGRTPVGWWRRRHGPRSRPGPPPRRPAGSGWRFPAGWWQGRDGGHGSVEAAVALFGPHGRQGRGLVGIGDAGNAGRDHAGPPARRRNQRRLARVASGASWRRRGTPGHGRRSGSGWRSRARATSPCAAAGCIQARANWPQGWSRTPAASVRAGDRGAPASGQLQALATIERLGLEGEDRLQETTRIQDRQEREEQRFRPVGPGWIRRASSSPQKEALSRRVLSLLPPRQPGWRTRRRRRPAS